MKKIIGFTLLFAFVVAMGLSAAPRSYVQAQEDKARANRELSMKERQLKIEQDKVARLERELAQAKTRDESVQKQAELDQLNNSCFFIMTEINGLLSIITDCDTVISQSR